MPHDYTSSTVVELCARNRGLIFHTLNFVCRGIDETNAWYNDYVSAGQLGLMKAAATFNPRLGFKFSTYACRVICTHMKRVNARKKLPIRRLDSMPVSPADSHVEIPGSAAESQELARELMSCLNGRQRVIVKLTVIEGRTLAAVGKSFGLSRERIRQIKDQAVSTMRVKARLMGVDDFRNS